MPAVCGEEGVDGLARADVRDHSVGVELGAILGADPDHGVAVEEKAVHPDPGPRFAPVLSDRGDHVLGDGDPAAMM